MTRAQPWAARPWPDAVPLYVTPRNLERPTLGPEVADISRDLGFEPMPWNLDMFDTMYEYTLVDTPAGEVKRLWYREARITVPRQSSKTTTTLVRHVHRMVKGVDHGWGARPVAAFTMQHASDARGKMVDEWMPIIEASKWSPDDDVSHFVMSNGKESVRWPGHGRMVTFPPNKSGAHGGVLDLVDIDEAFAFPDNRPEKGSRPAMITRPSPQLVIQSTAGTAESLYLKGKVEDGRARVESGVEGHVYYLEYAANPEAGDDVNDPDHWYRWMPALGYTQTMEALLIEHDNMLGDPDEWARAFCNLWTETAARIIPAASWEACRDPASSIDYSGRLWMACDATPSMTGNRWAAISISGYTATGEIQSEIIAHAPGLGWVAQAVDKFTHDKVFESVRVDKKSPIMSVLPDIELVANANIVVTDTETMAAACGRIHEDIIEGRFRHRGQESLDKAVAGAAKRTLLDAWAFSRRTSTSNIAPLVAAAQSHWDCASNPTQGLIRMASG